MCLFSILCSAKPQTARTTTNSCHHAFQASRYWKVPCFKATVSCVGCRGLFLCVRSFMWCASVEAWQRPHWAASSSYAYPWYREDRKHTGRRCTHGPTDTLVPYHQTSPGTPRHLNENFSYSLSSGRELQHRRLFADKALSKRTIKTRKH